MSINPSTNSIEFSDKWEWKPVRCYICGQYVAEDAPSGVSAWGGVAHLKCLEEDE